MAEQPHAVVVGNIEVARGTCSELVEHGFVVTHLLHPTDSERCVRRWPRESVP
jgi:hypothetical protein